MKSTLATLLLLFVSAFTFAQDDWETLEKDNYSINYPSHWEYSDKKPQPSVKFMFFSEIESQNEDAFRENVNMTTENLNGQKMSLSDYTELSINNIKKELPTAKFISNKSIKVNGIDVSDVIWTGTFGTVELKFRQFLLIHKGSAYILTYSSTVSEFENYSEITNTILNSFKFTK